MKQLMFLTSLLVTTACEPERGQGKQLDVAHFRRILQCASRAVPPAPNCETYRADAARIESIHIQPAASGTARYVITYRDRGVRDFALGEFPGKITDEIVAAEIPYNVATE